MLDISQVFPQIEQMIHEQKQNSPKLLQKLASAIELLKDGNNLSQLQTRVEQSKTSWLVAYPIEQPDKTTPLPDIPRAYICTAVDGSQIAPDQHERILCYLINLGSVIFYYDGVRHPEMKSLPQLFFREEELYEEVYGRKVLVQGEYLAAKRAAAEARLLQHILLSLVHDPLPVLGLYDGSLIYWPLDGKEEGFKQKALTGLLNLFDTAQKHNQLVAGFLSSSRSNEVINLLRLLLCPHSPTGCDQCNQLKDGSPPCEQLVGLSDTTLFQTLLKPRERSAVFLSRSRILQDYGKHQIAFFYLHVGEDIARVEFPLWVKEQNQLDLLHSLSFDQARKGKGYPISLAEAHERAVVKGSDREAFYQLVDRLMVAQNISAKLSNKAFRKRRGLV